MDSFVFLEQAGPGEPLPVYVLYGDEDFLKRRALDVIRARVLGEAEGAGEFSFSSHPGDKASYAAVIDELGTLPFLSPYRLVMVENADTFVSKNRPALEKYVPSPAARGVLVLDVRTWAATTRLAKLVPDGATVVCKAPPAYKLAAWCSQWCAAQHGKQLPTAAAQLLVDLVGADMGQLDQEMVKLAIYVGRAAKISATDVDQLVASGRTANVFRIFDALGEGRKVEALEILERLFVQGDDPMRLLGAFSMQLRRLAQTARLIQQRVPAAEAMNRAGIPPFARQGCEQQLRRLGRAKTNQLYDWLVETDLGLKGGSELPPRAILERLVVRLAK